MEPDLASTIAWRRGVARVRGRRVDGGPPVLVTTSPSTVYPSIVAYVLWINHTRTDLAYYPGRYEPPSAVDRGTDDRSGSISATGCWPPSTARSRTSTPITVRRSTATPTSRWSMSNATLVGYRDGTVNIVEWNQRPDAPGRSRRHRRRASPRSCGAASSTQLSTRPDGVDQVYTLGGTAFTPRAPRSASTPTATRWSSSRRGDGGLRSPRSSNASGRFAGWSSTSTPMARDDCLLITPGWADDDRARSRHPRPLPHPRRPRLPSGHLQPGSSPSRSSSRPRRPSTQRGVSRAPCAMRRRLP